MTTQSKFYCNINALTPTERAHHKQLTEKLIAARKDIVETQKGYEFQFTPANVTLAELGDWVAAEGKFCPFSYVVKTDEDDGRKGAGHFNAGTAVSGSG